MRDDDFFKDFHRETGRTFAKAGCLVALFNILWVLFIAAVILGGVYVLLNFIL